MKRTLGTAVLFVLLVLTVVAIEQLGGTAATSALATPSHTISNVVK